MLIILNVCIIPFSCSLITFLFFVKSTSMFIFHPMVSVTVFIVSRGSHWPDAYLSMCDIKSLSIYLSIIYSVLSE